jgi:phosphatidate cytidylyltransferase
VSELAKRIIVAVIAAPVAIAIVYVGGLPLAVLLTLVSAGCAWEYFRIARAAGHDPLDALGIPLAAAVPLAVYAYHVGAFTTPPSLAAAVVLVVFAAALWARGSAGKPIGAAATTLFGIAYTGGMLSFAYVLRYYGYAVGDQAGAALVAYPVLLTWATDIGAYAVGRLVKGPKLMPSVSPGKTISGAIGGVVVTMVASWFYVPLVLAPTAVLTLSPVGRLVFAAAVSVAAQIGDLAESLIKREGGVKDSSRLIPGHGGLLDRLDSLLFVLPISSLLLGLLLT